MRKAEFEKINSLPPEEIAKLPMDEWREYMAYRFKGKPQKYYFKPLKRTTPNVQQCIDTHNRCKNPKVKNGMLHILQHKWGICDNKDTRQPDYVERITRFKQV